ncbi:MAG: hypothetical protein WC628_04155 [Candidatus Omnitrophota bacterium]
MCEIPHKAMRKIKIAGSRSLYNFARVITKAFDFSFDHAFGFYDSFGSLRNAKMVYELFVDAGEEAISPTAQGVKKTKISQAFIKPDEKMLFLFDYGDEWRFTVELKEIRKTEEKESEPVILESVGKAPVQYLPCEEEG